MKKYLLAILLVLFPSIAHAGLTINGVTLKNSFGTGYYGCGETIMFIGDSITEADGYRSQFFSLHPACTYDAVGTFNSDAVFDGDHEGVGGDTTSLIVARLPQAEFDYWYSKNVLNGKVFIHMGTNSTSNYSLNSSNLVTLLDRIDQASINKNNGQITVYVALLVPNNGGADATTVTLNSNYSSTLTSYSADSIKIVEVDIHTAFLSDTYGFCSGDWAANCMSDTLHPDNDGYKTMAYQLDACITNPEATNCRSVNF